MVGDFLGIPNKSKLEQIDSMIYFMCHECGHSWEEAKNTPVDVVMDLIRTHNIYNKDKKK